MTKYEWESELRRTIADLPETEIRKALEYYGELFEDKYERGASEREIIRSFGNPAEVGDKILWEYEENAKGSRKRGRDRSGRAAPRDCESEVPVYSASNGAPYMYAPPQADAQTQHAQPIYRDPSYRQEPTATVYAPQSSGYQEFAQPVPQQPVQTKGTSGGRVALVVVLSVFLFGPILGLVISMWATVGSLVIAGGASAVAGIVYVIPSISMMSSGAAAMTAQLGVCLAAVGVGILLIIGGCYLAKLFAYLTKSMFRGIGRFMRNERGTV